MWRALRRRHRRRRPRRRPRRRLCLRCPRPHRRHRRAAGAGGAAVRQREHADRAVCGRGGGVRLELAAWPLPAVAAEHGWRRRVARRYARRAAVGRCRRRATLAAVRQRRRRRRAAWTEVDRARLAFSGLGVESYHESCVIADWSSAAEVRRCELDGGPRRPRTSELAVQVAMASRLNRLVSLGVAGLRLAGAALIPAADLAAALELLRPVRADIAGALGLGDGAHPTIVIELWPKGLRPPDATMPPELLPPRIRRCSSPTARAAPRRRGLAVRGARRRVCRVARGLTTESARAARAGSRVRRWGTPLRLRGPSRYLAASRRSPRNRRRCDDGAAAIGGLPLLRAEIVARRTRHVVARQPHGRLCPRRGDAERGAAARLAPRQPCVRQQRHYGV